MLEYLQYTFFQYAILGVVFISIAAAIIGTYIISRRLVAISGGVTHACFGGLGLGYFLGINPVVMAAVFAIASAMGVEVMAQRMRIREDSAIAVIWAIGMAIGVIFVFLTPGYVPELNSFLFGNILTITAGDLWAFGIFTAVLVLFFAAAGRYVVVCAFDRDFARVAGLPVRLVNYTMTVMVAVCIVLTIRLVGVMLLMSMLSLPIMTAEVFRHRFYPLMFTSIAISLVASIAGLLVGAVADVPCSAIIVIIMAAFYLTARLIKAVTCRQSRP